MRPTMSQYANKRDYDRAMAQRDLNPHKPARMAMWLWSANYAASGLGSMGYWDSLSESAKETCRRAVAEIMGAQDETPNDSLTGGCAAQEQNRDE